MGAELEAWAMSHLELVSDAAIKARIPQLEQLLPQLSKKLTHRSRRLVPPVGKSLKRGQLVESTGKVNGSEKDSCSDSTDDRIHPETGPAAR